MAEVKLQEGETLENALRRFKRKVQQEDIIKEVKRHSFYLKPGEKLRAKQALARKRNRKKNHAGKSSKRGTAGLRAPPPPNPTTVQVDNGAQLLCRSFRTASSSAWTAEQISYSQRENSTSSTTRISRTSPSAARPARPSARVVRVGFCQDRNHDHLLAMRPGNHGALQADPGPAGLLPGMLPEPQSHRDGGRRESIVFDSLQV